MPTRGPEGLRSSHTPSLRGELARDHAGSVTAVLLVSEGAAERTSTAWPGLLALGGVDAALLLAFSGRYGYHRDELYFLRAGAEPAFGCVDQPPLTPLLAHALDAASGGSLVALRTPSAMVAGLVVVLTGLIARELGAPRAAQVLAAACMAAAPVLLVGPRSALRWPWLGVARPLAVGAAPRLAGGQRVPAARPGLGDGGGQLGHERALVPLPPLPAGPDQPGAGARVGAGLVAARPGAGAAHLAGVRRRLRPAREQVLSTVAVLSDVHGVLPVLDAVLAEPQVAAADLVVVTGDHAAGPQPTAVLDRLAALGSGRSCAGTPIASWSPRRAARRSRSPTRSRPGPRPSWARLTWSCSPRCRTR